MNWERFKCTLSGLERCELTLRERQFVEAVKKYFSENGKVTDQQESVLEGIYREKIWSRKAFSDENNVPQRVSPQKPPECILLRKEEVRLNPILTGCNYGY